MSVAKLGKSPRKARGVARVGKKRAAPKSVATLRKKPRAAKKETAQAKAMMPQVERDAVEDPAEAGRAIQGQRASDIEWATYRALRSLGYDDNDIMFQVGMFGGRSRFGGGQILDFVVSTGAGTWVIDVRGQAYHGAAAGKSSRDRWRELQVLGSTNTPPVWVNVWEDVAHNWQQLRAQLLRELGAK